MSLQWTAIGGFLYFEIALVLSLMLPFISSSRWNRVFKSGFATMISAYANYYFTIFLVLLGVCFADSIREMRKYSHTDSAEASLSNNPNTVDHIHMKLFRAQRNFYIAGFSLFLWFVLRRLVTLISSEATLTASKEAAIKQAKSASDMAKKLMEDNDKGDDTANNSKNEIEELRKSLSESKTALRSRDADLDAIKRQAESTNREYDRLTEEYQKLQKQVESDDKKSS